MVSSSDTTTVVLLAKLYWMAWYQEKWTESSTTHLLSRISNQLWTLLDLTSQLAFSIQHFCKHQVSSINFIVIIINMQVVIEKKKWATHKLIIVELLALFTLLENCYYLLKLLSVSPFYLWLASMEIGFPPHSYLFSSSKRYYPGINMHF
jgi:hypothetical protein